MKKILTFVLIALVGGGVYWFFFVRENNGGVPYNPPTAEEIKRIEDVEQSSSQIAPNAVPGAGVRPKGSLPPTPPPTPITVSTSTATTSTSTEITDETTE